MIIKFQKKIGFVFLFLTCIFISCKKQNNNVPINSDLKKYFSYKPGTYWIYKDSLTGQIDSFAVLSNEFSTASSTSQIADIEIDNIAVFQNGNLNDTFYFTWTLSENNIGIHYEYYAQMFYPLFTYPFVVGQYNNIYYIKYLNNYYIYNTKYTDLYASSEYGVQSYKYNKYQFNYIYYIAKDIGIVKFQISHAPIHQVLELIKFNIKH